MDKKILNITELEYASFPGVMPEELKKKFDAKLGDIGRRLGLSKLGANVTVIAPGKGKVAFPFHDHRVNDELFFILEGEGEVRIGDERRPVKKGDFIACPPGGKDAAHQLVNGSDTEELRYLALSSKHMPEIADYPDTGKFGILTETFRFVGRADQSLDYWEGEK